MSDNTLINAKDISLAYNGHKITDVPDFHISEGDFLCVIGENGAGKTTLMKALLHLNELFTGTIERCNGLKLNDVGYLPQQTSIQKDFPASVKEVVISGCLGHKGFSPFYNRSDKALAQASMEKTGISHLAKKSYRNLSGGQQQRVLLARALCATRKILFMDEPVTGLDPEAAQSMYDTAKSLSESGIAVVMITHDMSPVENMATHVLQIGKDPFYGTREAYVEHEKASGGMLL